MLPLSEAVAFAFQITFWMLMTAAVFGVLAILNTIEFAMNHWAQTPRVGKILLALSASLIAFAFVRHLSTQ